MEFFLVSLKESNSIENLLNSIDQYYINNPIHINKSIHLKEKKKKRKRGGCCFMTREDTIRMIALIRCPCWCKCCYEKCCLCWLQTCCCLCDCECCCSCCKIPRVKYKEESLQPLQDV